MWWTVKKEGFRETGRGLAQKAMYPMDFILSSMGNHGRLSSRSDMIQFKIKNHSGCQVKIGEEQE